jgi:SulP family sulfate permease
MRGRRPTLRRFRLPRPTTGDLLAGFSVAVVLIPQSLAYADLAGLPPERGLFAAGLPPIVASLAASSPYLQTGPSAMTSLLTFGALSSLAPPGSAEYIELAALLALIVGVVRLLIGISGAGAIGYLMSQPVLVGFTSGAALLIMASQIPTAFGVSSPGGHLLYCAGWSLGRPGSWSVPAITLALVAVAAIIASAKIHRLVPGVVIAVAAGLVASHIGWFSGDVLGDFRAHLPPFSLSLPWRRLPGLVLPGVVIALVGFAEASAVARTFAARDRHRWNPDREFIGQGLANLAAGISGGLPVGGSFSRSSVNRISGARTTWSGMVTGAFVLAFLPAASVLSSLPRPVLAAIVIGAVAQLVRPAAVVAVFRRSTAQGGVTLATFAFTLALSPHIEHAVVLGVGISIATHLLREIRIDVHELRHQGTLRLTVSGVLYFGSAHVLADRILDVLSSGAQPRRLEIDLSGVGRLDITAAETLNQVAETAAAAGIEMTLKNVPSRVQRIISQTWPSPLG